VVGDGSGHHRHPADRDGGDRRFDAARHAAGLWGRPGSTAASSPASIRSFAVHALYWWLPSGLVRQAARDPALRPAYISSARRCCSSATSRNATTRARKSPSCACSRPGWRWGWWPWPGSRGGSTGAERTVLVPPQIQRGFWVSGNAVSREYLEEMAYWYAGLALERHAPGLGLPERAVPQVRGARRSGPAARGNGRARRVPAEEQRRHRVLGARRDRGRTGPACRALRERSYTWAGDKKAGERSATYLVGFKFMNGRLHVCGFQGNQRSGSFRQRCCWPVLRPARRNCCAVARTIRWRPRCRAPSPR
jgi:conjugal transfer pilus assembly protein TraE